MDATRVDFNNQWVAINIANDVKADGHDLNANWRCRDEIFNCQNEVKTLLKFQRFDDDYETTAKVRPEAWQRAERGELARAPVSLSPKQMCDKESCWQCRPARPRERALRPPHFQSRWWNCCLISTTQTLPFTFTTIMTYSEERVWAETGRQAMILNSDQVQKTIKIRARRPCGSDPGTETRIWLKREEVSKQTRLANMAWVTGWGCLQIIGCGNFGLVFKVRVRAATQPSKRQSLALKVIRVKRRESRELSLLKTLNHPNVVKLHLYSFNFYSYFDEESQKVSKELCCNLFFDFMPTTLYDLLRKPSSGLQPSNIRGYFQQLLLALEYLHQDLEIIHRDVKPTNLLICPVKSVLKICDFGSAIRSKDLEASSTSCHYICSR